MMKKTLFFAAALLLSSMAFAAKEKITINISPADLATKYNWTDGKTYQVFALDGNISVRVDSTSGNQSGAYNNAAGEWRIYQARMDSFWIEAANGATIDSVQLTYNTSNDGTWSTKRGSSLAKEYRIASGTQIYTGGQSKVCIYMGATSTKTNGQMRVTNFKIIYQGEKQKDDPSVNFANAVVYKRVNDAAFVNPLTNTSDGTVTYESDNEDAVVVDNKGNVTIMGVGDAKITVNVAASDKFNAASASYIVKVRPTNWNLETFAGAGTQSTSYAAKEPATSVNASEDTGLKWTVWLGYIGANSGNIPGYGPVIRQRKSTESSADCAYLVSDTIEGGIDSLAFQWNSNGVESGNWNTIVYINNDSVGVIQDEATGIKPLAEVPTFSVGNLKKDGKFVIRIVNATPVNSADKNAKRFVVGNLEWYSYSKSPATGSEQIVSEATAVKVIKNGTLYIRKGDREFTVLGF